MIRNVWFTAFPLLATSDELELTYDLHALHKGRNKAASGIQACPWKPNIEPRCIASVLGAQRGPSASIRWEHRNDEYHSIVGYSQELLGSLKKWLLEIETCRFTSNCYDATIWQMLKKTIYRGRDRDTMGFAYKSELCLHATTYEQPLILRQLHYCQTKLWNLGPLFVW